MGYVTQSAWGGLRLMAKREPIDQLLQSDRLESEERRGLAQVLEMRDFATEELGLPDNKSYRTYVDVGRPWVTWSVTAAPRFAVLPMVWCFPVAGCVSYRGYFSMERAERFAVRLREKGLDVATGPVTAFSTLGWFADPVLSTFLDRRPDDLAGLVFHELSHQVVYVKNDTTFNESFATSVEILGQVKWLELQGRPEDFARLESDREAEERFVELVLEARSELESAYARHSGDVAALELAREQGFSRLVERHEETRGEWAPDGRHPRWFGAEMNHARLAQVGSYYRLVPAFLRIFESEGQDFEAFYDAVRRIARMAPEEREIALGESLDVAEERGDRATADSGD